MDNLSENQFRENLNTRFAVSLGDDQTAQLELIECNDLGSTPTQEQFSLIFRGPLETFLPQMTYEMKHESLGDVSIFLVPIRKDAEFLYYEAVFNRLIEQPK